MKIIKYLFLIAVLLFVGLTVYVSTQSAQFKITKTKIIKTPINEVYNYVNDLKNWNNFIEENSNFTKLTSSTKTSGAGAKITFLKKENTTIYQITSIKSAASIGVSKNSDNVKAQLNWYFKDTLGGTKVTIVSSGSVDLKTKIKLFFQGGIAPKIANQVDLGLEKLNKILHDEVDSFKIIQNGIITIDTSFCIKRIITCYEKNVESNIKIVVPQLQKYCKQKNIVPAGFTFIDRQKSVNTNGIIQLSVCVPVSDSIYTSPNGVFKFAKIDKYRGLKATLQGNTIHLPKLLAALKSEISTKAFNASQFDRYIEIYKVGNLDNDSKTKWITEIIIPQEPEKPKYLHIKRPIGDTTREPGDVKPSDVNLVPIIEPAAKIN